jgi:hypothetical protein
LQTDPNEWLNLAGVPAHAATISRLARALPQDVVHRRAP